VAGGMESMSNCPYLLPGARNGYRVGNAELVDSMIHDGLWEVYENFHMGVAAELVAEKYKITREEQDQFAFESHRKAVMAMNAGFLDSQIVPVDAPQKKGEFVVIKRDESPRADTTLEALAKLRPPFKKDGTVTAGNAPGTNDGAAAVVVTSEATAAKLGKTPLARIVAQSVSGIEPKWLLMAPVEAVEKLLAKTGWDRDKDVDLYELNEAFAVQALATMRELRLNPAKVNVNGGAVAIGHPIGASGARILVTLLHEMQRRQTQRGIAALCLGGGNAVALAVER
jgi:acetyl-CoA C-acetyltransferase